MEYFVRTDKGKVRKTNQDSCYVGSLDDSSVLAVVCDGMGGTNGGEIASELAVRTITQRFLSGWREHISVSSVHNLFETSLTAANLSIYDEAQENPALSGMGSTVVSVALFHNIAMLAHAGDSRAYLIRNNSIKRLTKDHSFVQSLVDRGEITEKEAEIHPQRNLITKALGVSEDFSAEYSEIEIECGDILLLCSDGLTNYLKEADILNILMQNKASNAIDIMINTANANGGGDNISVVLITV